MKSGVVKRIFTIVSLTLLFVIIVGGVVFSLPSLFALNIQHAEGQGASTGPKQFPVTVDPRNKIIVEDANVNIFLESTNSPLQAAATAGVGNIFWKLFEWVATAIADAPWYRNLAGANGRFVSITPGMRKEQVAVAFADELDWNGAEKKLFTAPSSTSSLPLIEGSFAPGIYFVSQDTTAKDAQALVNKRFSNDVLAHYGTTTAGIVPLHDALTIASLIERETTRSDDMRLISGIIWNRIFINMKLQVDATLQYAKANSSGSGSWWPKVGPSDKYRKSPYNTYIHTGLPPAPIANPSVAAIVAALNPLHTSCLFYFNDQAGKFHCSDTYAKHVASLKKFYGQGK